MDNKLLLLIRLVFWFYGHDEYVYNSLCVKIKVFECYIFIVLHNSISARFNLFLVRGSTENI